MGLDPWGGAGGPGLGKPLPAVPRHTVLSKAECGASCRHCKPRFLSCEQPLWLAGSRSCTGGQKGQQICSLPHVGPEAANVACSAWQGANCGRW